MAYFASINTISGTIWVNLDYVLRVEAGPEADSATAVRLTNGEILKVPASEAANLLRQLTECNGHH